MSIETEAFFKVPKALHQTDLSISELYLYSRMLDDYDYYTNKRKTDYAPSHDYLAGLIQRDRAQTAGDTIKRLEKRGLVEDTGRQLGGRKIYKVIDFNEVEGIITKPTFQERREIKKEEKEIHLTETVNRDDFHLTDSVNHTEENDDSEIHLTETVNPFNGNRYSIQRKPLTPLTETVNMSDDSHTLTKLKLNDKEKEVIDSEKIKEEQPLRSHKVSYSLPLSDLPLSTPKDCAVEYEAYSCHETNTITRKKAPGAINFSDLFSPF